LSGTVWPIHFLPFHGESLSSWMSRLAIHHCSVPSTFFAKTVPGAPDAWKQDLDVRSNRSIIEAISLRCCLSPLGVERCTIFSEINKVYIPSSRTTALPRWVSPARIRRQTKHHYGQKFCVVCITENSYYRYKWRYCFYVVCPEHHVQMLDSCQACGGSVSTHKIYASFFETFPLDALAYCDLCGFDLRRSGYETASIDDVEFVESILRIMRQGYAHIGKKETIYSHHYFQGLRLIARGIMKKECMVRESSCTDIPVLSRHAEIEFIRVSEIKDVMLLAQELLYEWPNNFVTFSRNNGLYYQDWIRPRDVAPHWFLKVAKMFKK